MAALKKTDTIQRTLEEMNKHFKFTHTALIPVTKASVERSDSSLKFIKTATMGEEGLNTLTLYLFTKDAIKKIIDLYANRHPR